MTNFIETPLDPKCSFPQKVLESDNFKVYWKDCKGTQFYELRRSTGDIVQVYTDLKSLKYIWPYALHGI